MSDPILSSLQAAKGGESHESGELRVRHVSRDVVSEARRDNAGGVTHPQVNTSARRLIQDVLEVAHHAGWYRTNWEGSLAASDRIIRELGLESIVSVNIYTRQFVAHCPNNGRPIQYTLTIQVEGRVIQIEQIVQATESIRAGYHEDIADRLHRQFGGRQTLLAHHHGVGIETIRGAA